MASVRYTIKVCLCVFQFRCCGAENYTDWLLQGSHENISFVSHSCCHADSVACVNVVTTDMLTSTGKCEGVTKALDEVNRKVIMIPYMEISVTMMRGFKGPKE